MNRNSLAQFKEIFHTTDLNQIEKNYLIKIIKIYEDVTELKIIDEIVKTITNEKNSFKNELYITRINTLINDYNSKKYNKKEIEHTHTTYHYKTEINIYITKKIRSEEILDIINKYKYHEIYIIKTGKKIKLDLNENNLEKIKEIDNFNNLLTFKEYHIKLKF